ncbi:MAG TPA: tRNA (adenosine(37)-N6)-dimethylallyltransferase MiaA [Candidatus Angelobacter sp.]|nr:tRNA (adenosine(37)-N6)-dimethylallyltransferase MiaA [Candidatus Angelobacter sp.]
MSLPLVVVILGPTASGKSSLSVNLAGKLNGEVVSCDSVAVYRDLDIGAAKPSREDRLRVPHHLIDVVTPAEAFTAGDYSRLARAAIQQISSRGHLPIVAGGTGLYLRALLEGLFSGPPRSEELRQRLRQRAAERGPQYLHGILSRLDAAAARAIHANDVSKIVRAVEVCLSARQPMTELWQQGRDPLQGFRIVQIGLNPERTALYERINLRAQKMFEQGLVEETKALLQRYGPVRPLDSLGYRQAMQYLQGTLTLPEAIAAARQAHRNYAKRQITWFKREPDVQWFAGFGSDHGIEQRCVELVQRLVDLSPASQ